MRVSVWAYGAPEASDAERMAALGITRASLMVGGGRSKFALNAPTSRIVASCQALRNAGIEPILMSWAVAEEGYIRDLGRRMGELAEDCEVDTVEVDCEGDWTEEHDLSLLDARYRLLAALLQDPAHRRIRRLGLTVHSGRPLEDEWGSYDEIAVQAYSVAGREDSRSRFPGEMQTRVIASAQRRLRPDQRLVIGLAAYGQTWTHRRQASTLAQAWDACEAAGVTEVRYWSWTHIKKLAYARKFLERKHAEKAN